MTKTAKRLDLSPSEVLDYLKINHQVCVDSGLIISRRNGSVAGHINVHGYRVIQIMGKNYYAHRLIWLWEHGEWPRRFVDHINMVRDDNRLSNLRDVSHSTNLKNRRPHPDRVPGVSVDRRNNRFVAYIGGNKSRVWLGGFKTYGAACRARVRAEVESMAGVPVDRGAA